MTDDEIGQITRHEIGPALAALQPHQRNVGYLRAWIGYETHDGIHTFHPCACGRMNARSSRCAMCLSEMLAVVQDESKPKGANA